MAHTAKRGRAVEADILAPYEERPNGPALAGVVAAAFGTLVLGVLTTFAEVSASFKEAIVLREPVGPLSGKTTYAVAAWAVSWVVLGLAWRRKDVDTRLVVIVSAVLIGLGLLGTFPTFFEQFTAE